MASFEKCWNGNILYLVTAAAQRWRSTATYKQPLKQNTSICGTSIILIARQTAVHKCSVHNKHAATHSCVAMEIFWLRAQMPCQETRLNWDNPFCFINHTWKHESNFFKEGFENPSPLVSASVEDRGIHTQTPRWVVLTLDHELFWTSVWVDDECVNKGCIIITSVRMGFYSWRQCFTLLPNQKHKILNHFRTGK